MGLDLKKRLAPWPFATGYGVAVAALFINALLAFWSLGLVQSTWDSLVGGRDYLRAIDGILRDLKDAETGQRNYLLTSGVRYLKDYERSRSDSALDRESSSSGGQERPSPATTQRCRGCVRGQAGRVAKRNLRSQRDGLEAAIASIATDRGADAMDQLRETLVGMRAEEDATRDLLRAGLHTAITRTRLAFGFASFLSLALLFGVHHIGKRNNECLRRDAASLSVTLRSIADADKRKDEFLAMLAHELRNPIAAIRNAVSLATYSRAPENIDWTMEVIDRQSKHLARMIDDLLDVSRINRGTIKLRRHLADATAVVDSAIESVRPFLVERGHKLHVSVERGNLWLNCDPTRLEQVVTNLLNNAAKYTEDRGQIWLSAGQEDGEIVITIKDTGVGIPPDRLPEMFELFAQGDRTLARSEGGLGIGLTVVKRLVEAHGGQVTARSEGIGKGTEFLVRLPAAERPATDSSREMATTEGADRPARVFIVDDNIDMVNGLAKLLTLMGHDVQTAHNGTQALEAVPSFRPEVVLLDIGLPGMDGYTLVQQLRKNDAAMKHFSSQYRGMDRTRTAVGPKRPVLITTL